MGTLQDELAIEYKYKKLPEVLSKEVRDTYESEIPTSLDVNGDKEFEITSKEGTLISNGYERIVIGDYGAFIEFSVEQVVRKNIKIAKGQEYRIKDEKYKNKVKYCWLTAKDNSRIKIYYQKKCVSYADYKPEMFYVCPHEIFIA